MRRLSLTLLAAGAVLMGATPRAHAQYFNYLTNFQTPAGTSVVNAFSTDSQSALGIGNVAVNGVQATTGGVPVTLYTFATNSQAVSTDPNSGTFNYAYRVAFTITPSDASGTPLAGYNAITQYVTGTITGRLTPTSNTLVNTYNNLVSTPDGQAAVFNYVFSAAGMPGINVQLRALASGFTNGGSPTPKSGGATGRVVGTPEPGAWAMLFGMGLTGAAFARRRRVK